LVTGSYYYMSEVAFAASNNEIWGNPAYRGYDKGLIDATHGQTRGKAWSLREMVDAAWILPDGYPLKAEFNADVNNSLADFNANYTNNPNVGPLGIPNSAVTLGDGGHSMSPWQQYFLTWSANHAAELGFAGAAAFRDWLAKFDVALMGGPQGSPSGFCWLEASDYLLQVKDANGNWLPNFAAVYAAAYPTLAGLACNSPAMITAMGTLQNQAWKAGRMSGYAESATGFPSNLQIGLAAIADTGVPGAAEAWALFDSRSVQPDGKSTSDPSVAYRNYPNFAVIPRTAVAGVVPPPTMPDPGDAGSTPPPSGTNPPATTPPPSGTNPPVTTPPPSDTNPPATTPPPSDTKPPVTTPQPPTTPGLTKSFWTIVFNPVASLMPRCVAGCGTKAVVPMGAPRSSVQSAAPVVPRPVHSATKGASAPAPVPMVPAQQPTTARPVASPSGLLGGVMRVVCDRFTVWCTWTVPTPKPASTPARVRPRAATVRATALGQVAPTMVVHTASASGLIDRVGAVDRTDELCPDRDQNSGVCLKHAYGSSVGRALVR
jgi:hypothetical protein